MKGVTVVDLFCGVGGLTNGFFSEGFDVAAGIDTDLSCAYPYEKNNNSKFICEDVKNITGEYLDSFFGDNIKVLVGCAPCQPFSSYSFKHKEKDKTKYGLLYEFGRLVEECLPEIVSMENVPQLLFFNKQPVFQDFCNKLKNLGYYIDYKEIFCPDYGIPQRRKRLVLIASRLGEIKILDKTHSPENYVVVKDVIKNLPQVGAGEVCPSDKLHIAPALSEINLQRIKFTKEGGSWKDWPDHLKLDCHKKQSGKSYTSVYGRMKWDDLAPTMTTHCTGFGNGRFGHPYQDRAITLREAALFQTFPMDYDFFEGNVINNSSAIRRHIGNAVPPKLGAIIAKSIKSHLDEIKKE